MFPVCFLLPWEQRGQSVVVPVALNQAARRLPGGLVVSPGTLDLVGAVDEVW